MGHIGVLHPMDPAINGQGLMWMASQRSHRGAWPKGCPVPGSVCPTGGIMGNTATLRNGVNVEDLNALVNRVKENPAHGKFQFRSRSKWINRAHSQSTFDSLFGAGKEQKRATPLLHMGRA